MRRILVLRGGALGDFIVTLPALSLLRQRWPAARIELAGNSVVAALATARGLIDEAHSQHERRWSAFYSPSNAPLPEDFACWLKEFDLVINFWPDPDGEVRRRFPLRSGQTYIAAPAMPTRAPAAAHYCAALRELGLEMERFFFPLRRLADAPPSAKATGLPETVHAPVQNAGPIAIHPGSGSARKNWPAAHWLAVIDQLTAPVRLILGEAEMAQWGARVPPTQSVRPLIIPPLEDLVTTLAGCQLFLGHDSGVSHLAAACGVPCVLLFGPTDPAIWAPPAPQVRVLRAPAGLAQLGVDEVLQAVTAALADQK
jgi:heptosyltransferase III